MAWGWITDQIATNVMDANWIQAPNLPRIADIITRTVVFMEQCRFPLYMSKSQAEEWFLIWRMLNEQRMERNGWTFIGAQGEQNALHPSMAAFRSNAEHNQATARLRYLRARRLDSQEDDGEVWGEDSWMIPRQTRVFRLIARIFPLPSRLSYPCPRQALIHE